MSTSSFNAPRRTNHLILSFPLLTQSASMGAFCSSLCGRSVDRHANSPALPSHASRVRSVEHATGVPKVVANVIVQYAAQWVYALGGTTDDAGVVATVDRFDAVAGVWTAVAPMQTARRYFGALCLDGLVYVVGGKGADNQPLSSVERYDPAANAWSFVAALNDGRWGHAVCVLNGCVYAVGGGITTHSATSSVDRYDPATNSWTRVAPYNPIVAPTQPYQKCSTACVLDGCIFASEVEGDIEDSLASVKKYDPPTDSWSAVDPSARCHYLASIGVSGANLFVVRGCSKTVHELMQQEETLGSVEIQDAATGRRIRVTDMMYESAYFGLFVLNGRLTVVDGSHALSSKTTEQFDDAADSWRVVPTIKMPTDRRYFASCVSE
jgi:hypothetical protein